jgi:hypothetical protein
MVSITTTTVGSVVYVAACDELNTAGTIDATTTLLNEWVEPNVPGTMGFGRSTNTTVTPGATSFGWSAPTQRLIAGLEILPAAVQVAAPVKSINLNQAVAVGSLR